MKIKDILLNVLKIQKEKAVNKEYEINLTEQQLWLLFITAKEILTRFEDISHLGNSANGRYFQECMEIELTNEQQKLKIKKSPLTLEKDEEIQKYSVEAAMQIIDEKKEWAAKIDTFYSLLERLIKFVEENELLETV